MLLIGKRVTARMPEHVRVDPKVESSRFTETRDQSPEFLRSQMAHHAPT